jgi:hypothetical protein
MRKIFLTALILSLAALPAFASKIKNGEDVIKAMHAKYSGKWYKTLTFVQKNTQWGPDGTVKNSTWYEAMSLPGRLRIDFDPLDSVNGLMFIDGKQLNFNGGKLARTTPRIHDLMVLGFDVYGQTVEKTIEQLKELKYDLAVLSENEWQGRPVWVVGAAKDDGKAAQFWIDKDRLLFVKLIKTAGPDGSQVQETRFNKYYKVKGGGWVSPEVEFLVNGKQAFLEEYSDIQTDVTLDEALFDPAKFGSVDTSYFKLK